MIFLELHEKRSYGLLIKWQLASVVHRDKTIRIREGLLVILRLRFLRLLIFVVNVQRILFFGKLADEEFHELANTIVKSL